MAEHFLSRAKYMVSIAFLCVGSVGAGWSTGTDPVVRKYLRNIDETPSEEPFATKPTHEFDHLFESSTFSPPDEFRGAELRKWRDNTGAYEVQARLSMIYPEKVRLAKPNGRTTTVPMRRLSQADQAYVRWVADRLVQSGVAQGERNQPDVVAYPSR
ncbi:MAG: SHD1 domain-containing protein [Planctomycetota bacterium]|jgi:hypothetical protein